MSIPQYKGAIDYLQLVYQSCIYWKDIISLPKDILLFVHFKYAEIAMVYPTHETMREGFLHILQAYSTIMEQEKHTNLLKTSLLMNSDEDDGEDNDMNRERSAKVSAKSKDDDEDVALVLLKGKCLDYLSLLLRYSALHFGKKQQSNKPSLGMFRMSNNDREQLHEANEDEEDEEEDEFDDESSGEMIPIGEDGRENKFWLIEDELSDQLLTLLQTYHILPYQHDEPGRGYRRMQIVYWKKNDFLNPFTKTLCQMTKLACIIAEYSLSWKIHANLLFDTTKHMDNHNNKEFDSVLIQDTSEIKRLACLKNDDLWMRSNSERIIAVVTSSSFLVNETLVMKSYLLLSELYCALHIINQSHVPARMTTRLSRLDYEKRSYEYKVKYHQIFQRLEEEYGIHSSMQRYQERYTKEMLQEYHKQINVYDPSNSFVSYR